MATQIKGLVHPKMKILSVFAVAVFICSAEKEDIWKNVLIKQISFPIDYHIYGSQWGMRSV